MTLPRGRAAKYCDESVCLSVCPPAYLNKSSAVDEMGDHLAIIDMGRRRGEGLLCPFPWGGG